MHVITIFITLTLAYWGYWWLVLPLLELVFHSLYKSLCRSYCSLQTTHYTEIPHNYWELNSLKQRNITHINTNQKMDKSPWDTAPFLRVLPIILYMLALIWTVLEGDQTLSLPRNSSPHLEKRWGYKNCPAKITNIKQISLILHLQFLTCTRTELPSPMLSCLLKKLFANHVCYAFVCLFGQVDLYRSCPAGQLTASQCSWADNRSPKWLASI